MSKPIIHIDDVPIERIDGFVPDPPEAFANGRYQQIAARIGAKKLGYNITILDPGKRAYPAHNHHVNEEMFFIVQGSGEVRIGEVTHPIRAGDFIACPPGPKEFAHQIINTGSVEMRYLAVSTMESPEVVQYPDSNKIGVRHRMGSNEDGTPKFLRVLKRDDGNLNYWDGEG